MSFLGRMEIEADIRAALREVIDPELGFNIVDLGMIYDIGVNDNGAVEVLMTTTTRFCPATGFLQEAVSERASSVPGVTAVQVELTYDPPWGPDMMSPEVSAQF
jgi:metal-sulfur cluster biosynthetic enzyme